MSSVLCNDCACENVACGKCMCLQYTQVCADHASNVSSWRSHFNNSSERPPWSTRSQIVCERQRPFHDAVGSFAINSLAISDEMWFLTADPVVGMPMILTEVPQGKNFGSFFKKH